MLYKHIIQVENKNVGLKVCVWGGGGGGRGAQTYHCPPPPNKKSRGVHARLAPRFLRQWYIYTRVLIKSYSCYAY